MPANMKAGRSKRLGAPPCERLSSASILLCKCKGCTIRRAAVTRRVGQDFPAVAVLLVNGYIEGA